MVLKSHHPVQRPEFLATSHCSRDRSWDVVIHRNCYSGDNAHQLSGSVTSKTYHHCCSSEFPFCEKSDSRGTSLQYHRRMKRRIASEDKYKETHRRRKGSDSDRPRLETGIWCVAAGLDCIEMKTPKPSTFVGLHILRCSGTITCIPSFYLRTATAIADIPLGAGTIDSPPPPYDKVATRGILGDVPPHAR